MSLMSLIPGDPALVLCGVRIHILRLHQGRVSGNEIVLLGSSLLALRLCDICIIVIESHLNKS